MQEVPPPVVGCVCEVEPEIEVVSELERLADTGLGTLFDPARHEIFPTEWSRFAARIAKRDDIFMYRHKEHGSFVLAVWVMRPCEPDGRGGLMTEIHALPTHPDQYSYGFRADVPSSDYLRARLRPVEDQVAGIKKKVSRAKEQEAMRRAMDDTARAKTSHDLIKKGGRFADWGRKVASGQIPISSLEYDAKPPM